MLPLILSLSPAAVSAEADGEGDASNAEDASTGVPDDAKVSDDMNEEVAPEEFMKEMDKDNDGLLSLVELMPEPDADVGEEDKKLIEKVFNSADADKDGKLSAAELPMAMKEYEALSETEGAGGESLVEADGEEYAGSADDVNAGIAEREENMPEAVMKEMDTDKDGFLSLVELTSDADAEIEEKDKKLMEKAFNAADADKDGKLSAAELPMAMKEFETLSEAEIEGVETL